jgi:hypothetical protein
MSPPLDFKDNLKSSEGDILYDCHLFRRLYYILYFLWLYGDFFVILYDILKFLSNYNNKTNKYMYYIYD